MTYPMPYEDGYFKQLTKRGGSRKILHVIPSQNVKSCQKDSQRFQKSNDLEGARACKKYNEGMYGKVGTSSAGVLKHKGFDTLSLSPDANVRAQGVPPLFVSCLK